MNTATRTVIIALLSVVWVAVCVGVWNQPLLAAEAGEPAAPLPGLTAEPGARGAPALLASCVKTRFPGLQFEQTHITEDGLRLENARYVIGSGADIGSSLSSWTLESENVYVAIGFTGFMFTPEIAAVRFREITITGGILKSPVIVEDITFTRTSDGECFTITSSGIQLSGGTIEVSGVLPVSVLSPKETSATGLRVDLGISCKALNLLSLIRIPNRFPVNYQGKASGEVILAGLSDGFSLSGNVDFPGGRFVIEKLQKTRVPVLPKCFREIDIILSGKNIKLVTGKLVACLEGTVSAAGDRMNGLELSGTLNVGDGHILIGDTRFKVRKGTVSISKSSDMKSFTRAETMNGTDLSNSITEQARCYNYVNVCYQLDVVNEINEVEEYTATIKGCQDNYRIRLRYMQSDQKSFFPRHVTLNEPFEGETLQKQPEHRLQAQVLEKIEKSRYLRKLLEGTLGGITSMESMVGRALGVDKIHFSLKFSRLTSLRVPRVDISKHFGSRISLTCSRDFETSSSRLGFVYRPRRNVTVKSLAVIDDLNNQEISAGFSVGFEF